MIKDARVLSEEFVPDDVQHRDPEMNDLARALRPVTEGKPAETAVLFGPSGTGKTCIARFAVRRLADNAPEIDYKRVNCWQHRDRTSVLHQLVNGLEATPDLHRRSTPTSELVEWLKAYDDSEYVVILDEADQLEDRGILYDLYTIRNISIVLIVNRKEEFFASLDERVQSRFSVQRSIHFDSYGLNELVSILKARVRWGLAYPDAIGQEELEFVADLAAGDARKAIGILRAAAREAEHRGQEHISFETIDAVESEALDEIHQSTYDQLSQQQQILYDIIEDHDEIAPSRLYEEYRERVDDQKSERTIRNYLSKMEDYDLIVARGNKRGRTYSIDTPGED